MLRAKFLLFVFPVLLQGLAVGLFLVWWFALAVDQAAFALVAIALMVVGTLTLFVWGSAWDEDLSLAVEGATQTILQEETPLTPRRMWLLNLGLASFAGMVLHELSWDHLPVNALKDTLRLPSLALAGVAKTCFLLPSNYPGI